MQTNHSDHALDRMYDVIDTYGEKDVVLVLNQMAEAITALKTEVDSLWHIMTEASRRSQAREQMGMMLQGKDIGDLKGHQHGVVDQDKRGQYL